MRFPPALLLLLPGVLASRHNVVHEKPEVHEARYMHEFKWHPPFLEKEDPGSEHYVFDCTVEGTFRGVQYKLKDLEVDYPAGIAPWKEALKLYLLHDYFGSWNGIDPGGPNRDLVMMEYHDVPMVVREWVEEQHRIPYNDKVWLVGIFGKPKTPEGADKDAKPVAEGISPDKFDEIAAKDKVIIFAPGAIYDILPLFVAKNTDDPKCEAELRDLSKYDYHVKDDGVIAWPIERTEPDEKNGKAITFKVRAQHMVESDHGRTMRTTWERVFRMANRHRRRAERQERLAKRDKLDGKFEDDDDDEGHDEL